MPNGPIGIDASATGRPAAGLAWTLDWNLLRTFLVIMRERSITEAAQKLNLKQPTVSNALRRLEEAVGRRLVDRGPRLFAPTPFGEELYQQAANIFGSIDRLPALMERDDHEIVGRVNLSLATHVVTPLLDQALSIFGDKCPKASISISVHSSQSVIEHVKTKRCALGVCLVRDNDPELDYTHFFREHFGFFCGPSHRLFGKAGLKLENLKGERSVSFDTDRMHDVLRPIAILRETAGVDPEPAGVSNNLEEVRRMVIAGLGIAPLPIHAVERDVRDGLLWRLPPYENPPPIDIQIVFNPATTLNAAEKEFRKILMSLVSQTPAAERSYGGENSISSKSKGRKP
jgi:DNA-binding transcriptional LysR family regulator